MRQIKYKAYKKEKTNRNNIMSVNSLQLRDDGTVAFISGYCLTNFDTWFEGEFDLVEYTGLKDKNGKEIYEGDIVKWAGYKGLVRHVFVDKVEKGMWCFNNGFIVDLEYGKNLNNIEPEWVNLSSKYEVVGNIYEN